MSNERFNSTDTTTARGCTEGNGPCADVTGPATSESPLDVVRGRSESEAFDDNGRPGDSAIAAHDPFSLHDLRRIRDFVAAQLTD